MIRIRVDIDLPGVGYEAHEYEHCPIQAASDFTRSCPLTGIDCEYGLSQILPPKTCPMRIGGGIPMKFSIVEEDD